MSRTIRRKNAWNKSRYSSVPTYKFHGDRPKTYAYLFRIKELWRQYRAVSKQTLGRGIRDNTLDEYIDPHPKGTIDPWSVD